MGSLLQRGRVLVIDDELIMRNALRRLLRSEFEVVVAADGTSALALLADGSAFDAILCDVRMPGMDGLQFLEHLRELAPDLVARTAFISANVTGTQAEELARRTSPVIEKPFDPEALRTLVRRMVRSARST